MLPPDDTYSTETQQTAVLTSSELVQAIQRGELSRTQVREALGGLPTATREALALQYDGVLINVFATSQPPEAAPVTEKKLYRRACELAAPIPVLADPVQVAEELKRLKRAFTQNDAGTRRGKRCEYCRVDQQCMVLGCEATPVGTSTSDSKARFRCIPGLHLCNAHGLQVLVNRRTVATDNVYWLKDGRFVQNVFEAKSADCPTKAASRCITGEERRRRRLRRAVAVIERELASATKKTSEVGSAERAQAPAEAALRQMMLTSCREGAAAARAAEAAYEKHCSTYKRRRREEPPVSYF